MSERIPDPDLVIAISYAAGGLRARRLGRVLSEDECRELGKAVLAHFQLCGWQVWYDPKPAHSTP